MNCMKLTVCISSFNQVDYIDECINSLISQVVDFDFEIVISDDCSTDGTASKIEKHAKDQLKPIRVVSGNKNVGPFLNYLNLHSSARGEYVAHMDGDDVALPGKLQSQVDFLDLNHLCTVVWHRMIFFHEKGEVVHPSISTEFVGIPIYPEDMCLLGPMGPHSSTMYRRQNFRLDLFTEKCDDWLMALFYVSNGYAMMLEDVLGKYRIRLDSMSSGARATEANRKLSTSSQIMAAERFPQLSQDISTRALANLLLDFVKRRHYWRMHILVLQKCRSIPKVWMAGRLFRFYRWSKRPMDRDFVT